MNYKTEQEKFWAGDFGDEFITRNYSNEKECLASSLKFFAKAFRNLGRPKSLIEFGASIGSNLKALDLLYPNIDMFGIEINESAVKELHTFLGKEKVFQGSIFDFETTQQYEVALIKGVLININPDMLPVVYEKLYESTSKFILICEYYNPSPIAIPYRGKDGFLFKRDFAGELLEKYPDVRLLDYGFCYRRDRSFPLDDVTWFLLEKP